MTLSQLDMFSARARKAGEKVKELGEKGVGETKKVAEKTKEKIKK